MKKIKQSTTSSSTYLYNFVRPLLALRSTIRNAKSIHNKSRQRLTQDTYRRNSRRYLQQKGGRLASPRRNSKSTAKSPLAERKNQGKENICHTDMFPQQFVTSELICFCLLLSPEYGKHICPLVQQTTHKTTCKTLFCHLYPTDNIPEQSTSSSESELKKEAPVIPPRPSPELILERCSDNTRKKVSIRSRTSSAT